MHRLSSRFEKEEEEVPAQGDARGTQHSWEELAKAVTREFIAFSAGEGQGNVTCAGRKTLSDISLPFRKVMAARSFLTCHRVLSEGNKIRTYCWGQKEMNNFPLKKKSLLNLQLPFR